MHQRHLGICLGSWVRLFGFQPRAPLTTSSAGALVAARLAAVHTAQRHVATQAGAAKAASTVLRVLTASSMLRGTPEPPSYSSPTLNCASELPSSAARRYLQHAKRSQLASTIRCTNDPPYVAEIHSDRVGSRNKAGRILHILPVLLSTFGTVVRTHHPSAVTMFFSTPWPFS
jgi:hypothetical protein